MNFFGDAVAGSSGTVGVLPEFVLLAAFAGLMAAMVRELAAKPRRLAAPAPAQKLRRSR